MEDLGNKYYADIPGRARKYFLDKTTRSKSACFRDFEVSIRDVWEVKDIDHLISNKGRVAISEEVAFATAMDVLHNHQLLYNGISPAEAKQVRSDKISRFPGRSHPCKINNSFRGEDNEYKLQRFVSILSSSNLSTEKLRHLSWLGVPSKVRPTTWKILSGYLPVNHNRRKPILEMKRKEYWGLVEDYYKFNERDELYKKTYHQIHIDVPRMNSSIALLQENIVQKSFERILFVWAVRRPAPGYVQGMNDIVTPFYLVFLQDILDTDLQLELCLLDRLSQEQLNNLEADTFWCFSKFLDAIQNNYVFGKIGIHHKITQLKELVQRVDNTLHSHLTLHDVDYLQFSFRWFNNILTRELPLRCIIRLWDTYLAEAEAFATFQIYVCAAFMLHWREKLLLQKNFQELMLFLQHLPTENWSDFHVGLVIAEAYRLKIMFADAPSHLKNNYP